VKFIEVMTEHKTRARFWGGPAHNKWTSWMDGKPRRTLMWYRFERAAPASPENPMAMRQRTFVYELKGGRYRYKGEKRVPA
jgi:hypothetical protein